MGRSLGSILRTVMTAVLTVSIGIGTPACVHRQKPPTYLSELTPDIYKQGVTYEFDTNSDSKRDPKIVVYDYDSDGNPDEIREYNDQGQMTSYRNDADGNDLPEITITKTYGSDGGLEEQVIAEYDNANGKMTKRSHDKNGDGRLDEITTWRYDSNGRLVEKFYDGDADSIPEQRWTWTLEGTTIVVTLYTDYDDNGVYDDLRSWEHNIQDGTLTSRRKDYYPGDISSSVTEEGGHYRVDYPVYKQGDTVIMDSDVLTIDESVEISVGGEITVERVPHGDGTNRTMGLSQRGTHGTIIETHDGRIIQYYGVGYTRRGGMPTVLVDLDHDGHPDLKMHPHPLK